MTVPLTLILKSAAVLNEEELANAAAVAWEFLLRDDKETVGCAGTYKRSLLSCLASCGV